MHLKVLIFLLLNSFLYSIELQKPKVYNENEHEINGWYMSEKLDGIRAYWNGKELLSKNGNKIHAPTWFIKDFPKFELDGELWTKRDDFESIQNIVLDKTPSDDWKKVTYNIFEVPNQKGDFDERLKVAIQWVKKYKNRYIRIIPQIKCKNKEHLEAYLQELINKKAEGVIIKNPHKEYFIGRNSNILKVKKFKDMEGEIIGFNYDVNKRLKSLVLKLDNGINFNLGGGFKEKDRLNHKFKIGNIITFKYYGFTKYGKPKFASFLRVKNEE